MNTWLKRFRRRHCIHMIRFYKHAIRTWLLLLVLYAGTQLPSLAHNYLASAPCRCLLSKPTPEPV
jgi:hypothetical protein